MTLIAAAQFGPVLGDPDANRATERQQPQPPPARSPAPNSQRSATAPGDKAQSAGSGARFGSRGGP